MLKTLPLILSLTLSPTPDNCTTVQCCDDQHEAALEDCIETENNCVIDCAIKFGQGQLTPEQFRDCVRGCVDLLCEELADLEYGLCLEQL